MRSFDLVCNECRHHYRVESDDAWVDEGKHCPECGSDAVHQRFRSFLRNGSLLTEEHLDNRRSRSSCCCYGSQDDSCDREPR